MYFKTTSSIAQCSRGCLGESGLGSNYDSSVCWLLDRDKLLSHSNLPIRHVEDWNNNKSNDLIGQEF